MSEVEVIAVMGEGVIEFTPTPIVRCRDCAHFRENLMYGDSHTWCAQWHRLVPPDGYCHRGVRRDGHDGD
jgi:hypothetical protein